MILAIDAGNTNITIGVFDQNELVGNFRMNTKIPRTSDEYGILLSEILFQNGIDKKQIKDAIYASVVPAVNHSLISGIIKYFSVHPVIVKESIKTGIRIALDRPEQVGADRIVDAAGAYALYGGPVIVIDFGTATTYDLVNGKGEFEAGLTAPGVRISAKALWEDAAKLPEIEIKKPKRILAKETISSMQAGLVYGQIGQTEYIVKHMIEASGYENVKVVATGGLGNMISKETDCIEEYNPNLTLIGLNIVYGLNQDES
ncbi:MAG: type III pantothenate kinase [Lachnospiraceae bacterium]|nr:type III pantothenate kinase [Lachnospiraceae bacterium]